MDEKQCSLCTVQYSIYIAILKRDDKSGGTSCSHPGNTEQGKERGSTLCSHPSYNSPPLSISNTVHSSH